MCVEIFRLKGNERAVWVLDQWFSQWHLIRSKWLQEWMFSLGGTLIILFSRCLEWRSSRYYFHFGLIFNFVWADVIFAIFSRSSKHLWISNILLSSNNSFSFSFSFSFGFSFSFIIVGNFLFVNNLKYNFRCWSNWFFKLIFKLLLLGINRQLWRFSTFLWGYCWCSWCFSCNCSCSSSRCWSWFRFFRYCFFLYIGRWGLKFFSTSWSNTAICYNQFLS